MRLKFCLFIAYLTILSTNFSFCQDIDDLIYLRSDGKEGVQTFEIPPEDTIAYDGFKLRVGADFALQFQSLSQSNANDSLVNLRGGFNLPSANLDLDALVLDGVRLHLRTYLSSRHHPEAWIKGGHITIYNLDFIREGFLSGFMDIATLRGGMNEFNYGDTHFRRTDNAEAIYNPFVGNFIMDAFSTEIFGEVTLYRKGLLAVVGLTNGYLNQSIIRHADEDNKPSFYGKLGFDKDLNNDLRIRLTGSWYTNQGTTSGFWLYGGDRAGARYYSILRTIEEDQNGQGTDFEGRFNPRFRRLTAIQVVPFMKYKGMEFFGVYERAMNHEKTGDGAFNQYAADLIYRFGKNDQLYIGSRYNLVTGKMTENAENQKIRRYNIGGGWFISKRILAKFEYVNQIYKGDGWDNSKYQSASFNGLVLEATVSL